jgi:hypothetical protein
MTKIAAQINPFKIFLNTFTLLHFEYYDDAAKELAAFLSKDLSFMAPHERDCATAIATTLQDWVAHCQEERGTHE